MTWVVHRRYGLEILPLLQVHPGESQSSNVLHSPKIDQAATVIKLFTIHELLTGVGGVSLLVYWLRMNANFQPHPAQTHWEAKEAFGGCRIPPPSRPPGSSTS